MTDYEALMKSLNFGYDDLKFLVFYILKRHFYGHREIWDEMEDEANLVFLSCLSSFDVKKSFVSYLYSSILFKFRDMIAEKNGSREFQTYLKNKNKMEKVHVVSEDFEEEELPLDEINDLLKKITTQRNGEIFEYCWGINGKTKKTEKEIGVLFGISQARVAEVKNKLLKDLKEYFTK